MIEDRAGKPQLTKAILNLRKDDDKVSFEFSFMKDFDQNNYKPLLKKGVIEGRAQIKLSNDQKKQLSNVIGQDVSDEDFKKKYDAVPDDNPVKKAAKSIFNSIGGSFTATIEAMKDREVKLDTAIEKYCKENGLKSPVETIEQKIEKDETVSVTPEVTENQEQYKPLISFSKSVEQKDIEDRQRRLDRVQEVNQRIHDNLTQDQYEQMVTAYNYYAQSTAAQGNQPIAFTDYADEYINSIAKQKTSFFQQITNAIGPNPYYIR